MEKVKLKLSELTLDPDNAKIHTDAQVQQIVESIRRYGYNDPIGVAGENNMIVEGHGRYRALKILAEEDPKFECVDCIRLDHLSETQRKEYALAHNSTNMATGFDFEKLQENLKQIGDMEPFGLLIQVDESARVVEDDYEPPAQAPNKVKSGDKWQLGKHTLVCGDSTNPNTVEKVGGGGAFDALVTDPPYNVNYSGGTERQLSIVNDNLEDTAFLAFLTTCFKNFAKYLKDGGAFYVWYASREVVNFEKALANAGLLVKQQLIWVKNTFTLGRQDYQWQHEPCLYGWKDGAAHYFTDARTKSTVQEEDRPENIKKLKKDELIRFCEQLLAEQNNVSTTICREDKPARSELHPTMKPVRLMARLIANSTKEGDVVFDGFGGSGSTLIACEQLNRVCKIIEYDPEYASAIVDRWEKMTGEKAVKLEDGKVRKKDKIL